MGEFSVLTVEPAAAFSESGSQQPLADVSVHGKQVEREGGAVDDQRKAPRVDGEGAVPEPLLPRVGADWPQISEITRMRKL